jgi:hypothetical protein
MVLKQNPYQMFKIPLRIPGGQIITTFARVTPNTGWVFEQICKSGDLVIPEGEEYVITTDDLERRRFYFNVKHVDFNGQKMANVHFHTKIYACQINPSLENVSFSNEAPRGVTLRSAQSSSPPTEPPPEISGSTAPKPPLSPQPSASEAAKIPTSPMRAPIEELETLSEEEFKEALEYAKKLREGKKD